ncbi:hypothetical protein H5410_022372 [Solanum commersonii]|uniref:Uncharacterized protein n=1 Tax=Solanum commersonii TaxID=4109 RepID=A0A9J5ZDS8_SOLCO|nr:hypothetical protein H5410_022372 [Solanum commersonii]
MFCNMVIQEGVVLPLVALSQSGTPKEPDKRISIKSSKERTAHSGEINFAATLFSLSAIEDCKIKIGRAGAGAVMFLVELMDPAAGMVDKAVIELGSARGKVNAAATLFQLCTNSSKFCKMVLHEGAVPPLVALA